MYVDFEFSKYELILEKLCVVAIDVMAEGDISSKDIEVCLSFSSFATEMLGLQQDFGFGARLTYDSEGVLGGSVSIRSCTDLTRSARLFLDERKNL